MNVHRALWWEVVGQFHPVMRFRAGFAPTLHVKAARNPQVLHLLLSRIAERQTALKMMALRCLG